jgi:hypothetical protein
VPRKIIIETRWGEICKNFGKRSGSIPKKQLSELLFNLKWIQGKP